MSPLVVLGTQKPKLNSRRHINNMFITENVSPAETTLRATGNAFEDFRNNSININESKRHSLSLLVGNLTAN